MAFLLQTRATSCLSCLRHTIGSLGDGLLFPGVQQIRGKKQLAKEKKRTVTVKLQQNIIGYGREGRIVQIPPSLMRNTWFPRAVAVYVTPADLEALGTRKIVAPRDTTFGKRNTEQFVKKPLGPNSKFKKPVQKRIQKTPRGSTQIGELDPERSRKILSELIPPILNFYRIPIIVAPFPVKKISKSIPASSILSAAAGGNVKSVQKIGIYDFVSTTHIALELSTILMQDEEAKQLNILPKDITFVSTDEKDVVKHLGIFEFDIRVKGAPEVIRKKIEVHGTEKS